MSLKKNETKRESRARWSYAKKRPNELDTKQNKSEDYIWDAESKSWKEQNKNLQDLLKRRV